MTLRGRTGSLVGHDIFVQGISAREVTGKLQTGEIQPCEPRCLGEKDLPELFKNLKRVETTCARYSLRILNQMDVVSRPIHTQGTKGLNRKFPVRFRFLHSLNSNIFF